MLFRSSKDWLKGCVTTKAKSKIRQYVKTEERKRAHDLGKEMQIDGESYTVAGVMPRNFRFPKAVNLWLPLNLTSVPAMSA